MKKIIAVILVVFMAFSISVFADEVISKGVISADTNGNSVVMAINKEVVIVNGVQSVITAPVLVFDKTYVDLYAVAPLLGARVYWIEDYVGFFRVDMNETAYDFTLISHWDDLNNQKHKFFVKDSKIFVSLRELSKLTGHNISYTEGIITVGTPCDFNREIFGDVNTYHFVF